MLCQKYAFKMLNQHDKPKATMYFGSIADRVVAVPAEIQLELICFIESQLCEQPVYFDFLYELLGSSAVAVKYSAATVLIGAENNSDKLKKVAKTLIELLESEIGNTSKTVLLNQAVRLQGLHSNAFVESVPEILQALSKNSSSEIRIALLSILSVSLSPLNAKDAINFAESEFLKHPSDKENRPYKLALSEIVFSSCLKYPEIVAEASIAALVAFLNAGVESKDVIGLLKKLMEYLPKYRGYILAQLIDYLNIATSASTVVGIIWIFGHFTCSFDDSKTVLSVFNNAFSAAGLDVDDSQPASTYRSNPSTILPDGTYATSFAENIFPAEPSRFGLKKYVSSGSVDVCAAIVHAAFKIILRLSCIAATANDREFRMLQAEVTCFLMLGSSTHF